jgi:hypothetical protein
MRNMVSKKLLRKQRGSALRTFLAITLFIFTVSANAGLIGSFSFVSNPEGEPIEFDITSEQFLKTPIWKVQDDSPPLSPRKADKAATAMFHKLIKNTAGWERESINLKSMGDGVHWVYEVVFSPVQLKLGVPPTLHIFVLMDGAVVEPKGGIPK